jgi:hypothetical protein
VRQDGAPPAPETFSTSPPRRRIEGWRPWEWALLVGLAIILGLATVTLVTIVPVLHSIPESFVVPGRSFFACGTSPNFSSPHDGSFAFSWFTSSNQLGGLYLLATPPGPGAGLTEYANSGTNGSGNVYIYGGYTYSFNFCANGTETVQISGTLYYEAPLL